MLYLWKIKNNELYLQWRIPQKLESIDTHIHAAIDLSEQNKLLLMQFGAKG
ncbi:Phosphofructokinase [Neochlamydia sp. S13]|nr:Phosphofructokinase [Neochlamydia sp. S13]